MTNLSMPILPGKLIIARHHESEWNKLGLWTGMSDVCLTPLGRDQAKKMGEGIRDLPVDRVVTSELRRAIKTAEIMLSAMGREDLTVEQIPALNERDYGDYTGKNKWQMKEILGDEKFHNIRRGWDCPVPSGETLKMVYERVIPFYINQIVPDLVAERHVMLVGHTNTLRALIKYLEKISDDGIKEVEIAFGLIIIYQVDDVGQMVDKEIRELE